jgi:hypothetical protein
MAAADIIMFESQNELDDDTGKQLLVVTTFLTHQRKPFAVQFFYSSACLISGFFFPCPTT